MGVLECLQNASEGGKGVPVARGRGIKPQGNGQIDCRVYQKFCYPCVCVGKGYELSQSSQNNGRILTLGIFKSRVLSFFTHQKENAIDKDYAVFMNTLSLKMKNSPFYDNVNSSIKH